MELAGLGIFICYFDYPHPDSFSLPSPPGVLMNSYSLSVGWEINQQRRWKLTSQALGGIALLIFSVDDQLSSSLSWRLNPQKSIRRWTSVNIRTNCPQSSVGVCLSGCGYQNFIFFRMFTGPFLIHIFTKLEQFCSILQEHNSLSFQVETQTNIEGICGITWE